MKNSMKDNCNMSGKSGATRDDIINYTSQRYSSTPEYLWYDCPDYVVFRRSDNKKWYGIIMDVPKKRLGLYGSDRIDILDIKCSSISRAILMEQKGFMQAYHLNRENWIGILLDGSVDKNLIFALIDESYNIVGMNKKKSRTENISWVIPANPEYFDIKKEFSEKNSILWKQSNSFIKGDIVYIYEGSPLSCIHYKCRVTETDIPFEYADKNIRMTKAMKLELLYTFDVNSFALAELRKHGLYSVRCPRKIPFGLLYALEEESRK